MKKMLLLLLALASAGAFASAPAPVGAGPRCGWVCSAPNCCTYCCIDQPCVQRICDPE